LPLISMISLPAAGGSSMRASASPAGMRIVLVANPGAVTVS
jgi:hypothetical protein